MYWDSKNWLADRWQDCTGFYGNRNNLEMGRILHGYGCCRTSGNFAGIFEAADLDGANAWHKFVYITLPQLKPVLTYIILMCVIGTFQEFDLVYTMTNGGYGTSTYLTGLTLYKTAFSSLKMGYSCTMAVFIFILSIIISVVQLKLTSDKD